jgi:ribokinase
MRKDLVTIVGSYNVGLFLKGRRLPALGETVIADEFKESGGGKGSNQAVAAAKLGAKTRFIGCIGRDKYGEAALALYRECGISSDRIKVDPTTHSGISVILIDSEGRNLISVVPGANLRLSKREMDGAVPLFRESCVVGFQLENDHETVFYGIRRAHELGVTTFLDPAPAAPIPENIYPCLDIIKPNETEASILTGIPVRDLASAAAAGRRFLERGVKTSIITLGAEGALLSKDGSAKHFPCPRVAAVDTTGAGDIFSGGFLACLSVGKPVEEAIAFANAAASLSTTRLGVIESIPTYNEAVRFMAGARQS